jgi:hypothetical protein
VQRPFHPDDIQIGRAVRKTLLRAIAGGFSPLRINLLRPFCRVKQQEHFVAAYFQKTTAGGKKMLRSIQRPNGYTAGIQRREKWGMIAQHLKPARDTGRAHADGLRAEDQARGRNDFHGERFVKHGRAPCYAAISFLAFSTASSIGPTIMNACSGKSS